MKQKDSCVVSSISFSFLFLSNFLIVVHFIIISISIRFVEYKLEEEGLYCIPFIKIINYDVNSVALQLPETVIAMHNRLA